MWPGPLPVSNEGYAMPDLTVPITGKTINLPALTGKPNDPLNYLGAMAYTLTPGLEEADRQVDLARERLEWVRISWNRVAGTLYTREVRARYKTQYQEAETALQNAERRRAEAEIPYRHGSCLSRRKGLAGHLSAQGRPSDDLLRR